MKRALRCESIPYSISILNNKTQYSQSNSKQCEITRVPRHSHSPGPRRKFFWMNVEWITKNGISLYMTCKRHMQRAGRRMRTSDQWQLSNIAQIEGVEFKVYEDVGPRGSWHVKEFPLVHSSQTWLEFIQNAMRWVAVGNPREDVMTDGWMQKRNVSPMKRGERRVAYPGQLLRYMLLRYMSPI